MTITVIVCAHNEAAYIGPCLVSLLSQTRGPDEVLVINNASTDRTGAVAAAFGMAAPTAPLTTRHTLRAARQARSILVAEDNEINQKLILRQLALLGFAANVAGNGRLALERWQTGHYALLLTDLQMPQLNGFELAAAIREQERGAVTRMPIVALTADAGDEERARALKVGMDDFLTKPIDANRLLAVAERFTTRPNPATFGVE